MKYLFTLLAILVFMQSFGQNYRTYVRDSIVINRQKKEIITLGTATADTGTRQRNLPFSSFICRDVTADSSYIGVNIKSYALPQEKSFEKAMFEKGTSATLTNYLNSNPNFLFTATGVPLTCFVKQLRITEIDSINKVTNNRQMFRRMRFEVEGYLGKENLYHPALRLDTLALSLSVDKNDFSVLEDVLEIFAAKAALIDTVKIFTRNGYTLAELDKRYQQRFNKPILQARDLVAGVYKSFTEFINNSPSLALYKVEKNKGNKMLYSRDADDEPVAQRKAFGFCDGRVIWINVADMYYPLIRHGNTFEFLASYYALNNRTARGASTIIVQNNPLATLGASALATAMNNAYVDDPANRTVYQLNMENGDFN